MTVPLRTRFAPSPTGSLHVGGVRTALYCRLVARQTGGRFLLRIEDTDRARSTEEAASGIVADLRWLGLTWDEGPDAPSACGPFFQSQRLERYDEVLRSLLASGHAYEAWEDAAELAAMRQAAEAAGDALRYRRRQVSAAQVEAWKAEGRRPVVRLAAPNKDVTHDDVILGPVTVEAAQLDDFVLRKADGFPTYHFAVVVDDHDMGIDLVLRGQEHLMNTHKHLQIYEALGWTPPRAGHLPLIFNPTGTKMSKRDKARVAREAVRAKAAASSHGKDLAWLAELTGLPVAELAAFMAKTNDGVATATLIAQRLNVALPLIEVADFRMQGFLPEAIVNMMALLGFGTEDGREVLSQEELAEVFDLRRVNLTAARFDETKARWMNGQWMVRLSPDALAKHFEAWCALTDSPFARWTADRRTRLLENYKARASTFAELAVAARAYLVAPDSWDEAALRKHLGIEGRQALSAVRAALGDLEDDAPATVSATVAAVAERLGLGLGKVAQPLRVAFMGVPVSPPIEETYALLGREEALSRIDRLLAHLG